MRREYIVPRQPNALPLVVLLFAIAVAVFAMFWGIATIHDHMTRPLDDADLDDDADQPPFVFAVLLPRGRRPARPTKRAADRMTDGPHVLLPAHG
jgi:hypothetical protein